METIKSDNYDILFNQNPYLTQTEFKENLDA